MRKSRFTETQIVSILKEGESGLGVNEVCRNHGISTATYYKWRSKYGGLEASHKNRVREQLFLIYEEVNKGVNVKKILFVILLSISTLSFGAPVWTNALIDLVFAGYPDGSIGFKPFGGVSNPAGCANPTAYVMQSDHDTKAALSVLLAAKMSGSRVYFSVRDDVCHTVQQTDGGQKIPVIQRIGVQ